MSLRAFHMVFITLSVALVVLTVGLSVIQYIRFRHLSDLGLAALSVAACAGLITYSKWFVKKMNRMEANVSKSL